MLERERNLRCACVLGILEKLIDEVSAIRVEVLEDVEVDFALVGIKAVDELAALVDQIVEEVAASERVVAAVVICSLMFLTTVANFAAKPSSVALPVIWSSGMSR